MWDMLQPKILPEKKILLECRKEWKSGSEKRLVF